MPRTPAVPKPRDARRTTNTRVGGRAARVVDVVLRTTLEVLGEVGYDQLRVDEVARRSDVNKTTIYRRWPTRAGLVGDALQSMKAPEPPQSGDLRTDLVAHVSAGVAWLQTPLGRGIAEVITRGGLCSELHAVVVALRQQILARRQVLLDAAVTRGELPPGTDTRLVLETIHTSIYSRIVRWGEDASAELIEGVIDLVLAGARAGGAVRRGG